MKQTLDSSLLYARTDGTQAFVHDTVGDFFLAKYYIQNKINPLESNHSSDAFLIFYVGFQEDSSEFIVEYIRKKCDDEKSHTLLMDLFSNASHTSDFAREEIAKELIGYHQSTYGLFRFPDRRIIETLAKTRTDQSISTLIMIISNLHDGPNKHSYDDLSWEENTSNYYWTMCMVADQLVKFSGEKGIDMLVDYFGNAGRLKEFVNRYYDCNDFNFDAVEQWDK